MFGEPHLSDRHCHGCGAGVSRGEFREWLRQAQQLVSVDERQVLVAVRSRAASRPAKGVMQLALEVAAADWVVGIPRRLIDHVPGNTWVLWERVQQCGT